jgi:biopolymer transport protein ExbD
MGGGAMPEQGGGKKGKKSLDAVINVVPAIDLLSCCITFLLYTAVWTQISRLQVQQFGSGAPEPPPAGEQQKTLLVTVLVRENKMVLQTSAGGEDDIPLVMRALKPARPDAVDGARDPDSEVKPRQDVKGLAAKLKVLRSNYPEAVSVTIASEDTIQYGDLIEIIDTCVGEGLVSVSVTEG